MFACVLSVAAQTCLRGQTQQSAPENTAQLIGASSEIRKLGEISGSADAADKWQILWLHQRISEKVTAASLQVDATIAQIDNEIARANELRGFLSDRRDRVVSRANLWGAIIGGDSRRHQLRPATLLIPHQAGSRGRNRSRRTFLRIRALRHSRPTGQKQRI